MIESETGIYKNGHSVKIFCRLRRSLHHSASLFISVTLVTLSQILLGNDPRQSELQLEANVHTLDLWTCYEHEVNFHTLMGPIMSMKPE